MVQLLGALDAVRASVDAQREVGIGVIEVLEGEMAVAVVLREEGGDEVGADVRFVVELGFPDGD
jgi:hypothetical protein